MTDPIELTTRLAKDANLTPEEAAKRTIGELQLMSEGFHEASQNLSTEDEDSDGPAEAR